MLRICTDVYGVLLLLQHSSRLSSLFLISPAAEVTGRMSMRPSYIVLPRTVLYCAVLYCTVLCCTVLYCTVLSYRQPASGWRDSGSFGAEADMKETHWTEEEGINFSLFMYLE
jgi:hypothetical protein